MGRLAQRRELLGGRRHEPVLAVVQLARHRHLARPAVCLLRHCALPHREPANHQAAAVRRLRDLRRVEIEAVVEDVERIVVEDARLVVHLAEHRDRLMQVEVALAFRLDALRRENQRLVAVELREIRALPHEALIAVRLGHDMLELPVLKVFRLKDEHLAHLVGRLRADDCVVAAVVLPDLRIAEVVILTRRDTLR